MALHLQRGWHIVWQRISFQSAFFSVRSLCPRLHPVFSYTLLIDCAALGHSSVKECEAELLANQGGTQHTSDMTGCVTKMLGIVWLFF